MRIVHISDTHCKRYQLPPGDILVHSGDFTNNGMHQASEIANFVRWWDSLASAYRYRVLVPGNHEWGLDRLPLAELKARLHCSRCAPPPAARVPSERCGVGAGVGADSCDQHCDPAAPGTPLSSPGAGEPSRESGRHGAGGTADPSETSFLLVDESVTLLGLLFHGTPWTNVNMAWSLATKARMARYEKTPRNVDVLVSHSPPHGILDGVGRHLGCRMLAHHVGTSLVERSAALGPPPTCAPSATTTFGFDNDDDAVPVTSSAPGQVLSVLPVHMFGHIHESHGLRLRRLGHPATRCADAAVGHDPAPPDGEHLPHAAGAAAAQGASDAPAAVFCGTVYSNAACARAGTANVVDVLLPVL